MSTISAGDIGRKIQELQMEIQRSTHEFQEKEKEIGNLREMIKKAEGISKACEQEIAQKEREIAETKKKQTDAENTIRKSSSELVLKERAFTTFKAKAEKDHRDLIEFQDELREMEAEMKQNVQKK